MQNSMYNFPETVNMLKGGKGVYTGFSIRKELLTAVKKKGWNYAVLITKACNTLNGRKPWIRKNKQCVEGGFTVSA